MSRGDDAAVDALISSILAAAGAETAGAAAAAAQEPHTAGDTGRKPYATLADTLTAGGDGLDRPTIGRAPLHNWACPIGQRRGYAALADRL